MDPTRDLCKVQNSFSEVPINYKIDSFQLSPTPMSPMSPVSPRATRNRYFKDSSKKYKIDFKSDNIPIDIADPYLKMKDEYFKERSGLILANLDLIFNFSDQDRGYIVLQYLNKIDYAVLDGDEGFLKYLSFRLPKGRGFTNCSGKNVNINRNCENGIDKYILSIVPEGVNLVVSNSLNYKENLLDSLKIIKRDGTFISRVDTDTPLEYLFITSLCFDKFTIFKPFLENLNENYSYIVAEKYKGNSIDVVEKLENFKGIDIDSNFINYIKNYYNSLKKLKENLQNVEYNMYRCKSILNLI